MAYTILIIDDSAIVRRALRRLLETQSGWQVCGEAENGFEGIAKARELKPDLIVLDLVMPVMNGLDVARGLRRLLPVVPVIMFTTVSNSQVERDALLAGVTAVRSKLDVEALVECIREWLPGQRGHPESSTLAP